MSSSVVIGMSICRSLRSPTDANAQQLRLVQLQILNQLLHRRHISLLHVVPIDVSVSPCVRRLLRGIPRRLRRIGVRSLVADTVASREVDATEILLPVDVFVFLGQSLRLLQLQVPRTERGSVRVEI